MPHSISICTLVLIGVTIFTSWQGFRSSIVEAKYIFNPEAILAGKQFYRLVTPAFLHADGIHLALNMLGLYLFGTPIEFYVGSFQFLLIYFGAIVGGSLLSLFVHRYHDYRAYGAS